MKISLEVPKLPSTQKNLKNPISGIFSLGILCTKPPVDSFTQITIRTSQAM